MRVLRTRYRPWKGQAWIHRSAAIFRTAVCARQVGKSHCAAFESLRTVLWRSTEEDGRHVAVLAPTYKIAKSAIAKLREFAGQVLGDAAQWREQDKEMRLPGGRLITIFSADRKEAVRGPTLCLLWIDEGAYLHHEAREAAEGCLSAVQGARVLVTTTPAGKNWVHRDFTNPDEASESFRFRTEDSPFANLPLVARLRARMSPEKARQEFDAEFVDSILLAFPDVRELVVSRHERREGAPENVIGVDVARDQDWTVATLMNRWGQAEVLLRAQKGPEATFYPSVTARIAELAKIHQAVVCIDTAGPGNVVADYLEGEHGVRVVRVRTNVVGEKTAIVESCRAEVQWQRITVLRNEHADQLLDEASKFQGIKRIQHGQEHTVYEAPQIDGEHDDCVISLCLANWGRLQREVDPHETGDFTEFFDGLSSPAADQAAPDDGGDWSPLVGPSGHTGLSERRAA